MSDFVQQGLVGLAALAAAVVILRRVIGVFRRPRTPAACDHCAIPTLVNGENSQRAQPSPSSPR